MKGSERSMKGSERAMKGSERSRKGIEKGLRTVTGSFCRAAWGPQRKAVETYGRGSVLTANAVETHKAKAAS